MLNKIFLILLAAAALGMLVLTYFQHSWLQSITKPADVIANYNFYDNIYSSALWISSLALLIVGNVILWKLRKSWAMWATLVYFAAFVLIQTWWLNGLFNSFSAQPSGASAASFKGVLGVVLCIAAAVIVFFDQFIVLRMRDRMHGDPALVSETAAVNENSLPDTERNIENK